MRLDSALCEYYLKMPHAHWQEAQKALDFMCDDQVGSTLLEAVHDAFFIYKNPKQAARECGCLMQYMNIFAPQLSNAVFSAVFASALPTLLTRLKAICKDAKIVEDTLSDYGIWARIYEKETGTIGIGEFEWICILFCQRIFRIGRLQYECTYFEEPFYIFQMRKTGDYCATPVNDLISASGKILKYHPIDGSTATASHKYEVLDVNDVDIVLAPGMPVLNIHIPEAGPLENELVDTSLEKAKAFFAMRNYPSTIAVCESWLLDTAVPVYAHQSKNICAFQQRFYKYSLHHGVSDTKSRICGKRFIDAQPESLPVRTSLQRGLREYLLAGGDVANASGFLLL